MGLAIYTDRIRKPKNRFGPLNLYNLFQASRFYWKESRVGLKATYRRLKNLKYDAHGLDNYIHRAIELCRNQSLETMLQSSVWTLVLRIQYRYHVDENHDLCVRFFWYASREGSSEATMSLCFLELYGMLVPCGYSEAYLILKEAENKGVLPAQESLALLLSVVFVVSRGWCCFGRELISVYLSRRLLSTRIKKRRKYFNLLPNGIAICRKLHNV